MSVQFEIDQQALLRFESEFTTKLNALIDSVRNPDGSMPLWKLASVHTVLLTAAGYIEAQVRVNLAKLLELKGVPCPDRFSIDEVYFVYTSGFNLGTRKIDEHREEVEAAALKAISLGYVKEGS